MGALLAFPSSVEPLVSWTRDYTSIESRLAVPMGDRTDVARAIQFAIDYVVAEWGTVSPPCQIVVVTDSRSIDAATADFAIPFPCKLHVPLLASARLCNPLGFLFIHCPNGALSFQSSSDLFRRSSFAFKRENGFFATDARKHVGKVGQFVTSSISYDVILFFISHIVNPLVRARAKGVQLHKDGPDVGVLQLRLQECFSSWIRSGEGRIRCRFTLPVR